MIPVQIITPDRWRVREAGKLWSIAMRAMLNPQRVIIIGTDATAQFNSFAFGTPIRCIKSPID
jgi:hypothetical protein